MDVSCMTANIHYGAYTPTAPSIFVTLVCSTQIVRVHGLGRTAHLLESKPLGVVVRAHRGRQRKGLFQVL